MTEDRCVELLVFVGEGCPFCARAIENAQQAAAVEPRIRLEIVDAEREPERAEALGVASVPLTIVAGELRKSGVISSSDLVTWVSELGTSEHAARLVGAAVENGRLEEGVERILAPGGGHAFARAWHSSAMSLRLGLMLALEDVLAQDPHALDDALPALLATTSTTDVALRGDTADLLGRIGDPSARPALEGLTDDPNPDVREAAHEALASLRD